MYTHFKLIIAAPSLVRYQLLFAFFFGIQPDKTLSMCGHKSFCVAQLARVVIFRKSLIPIQSANQVVLKFSYFSKPINCKTAIFLCWWCNLSGARLKIEGRQGRGFCSTAAHLPGPSHAAAVIIFLNHFVKKIMIVNQSSDISIFFHMMEALSGT